MKILAIISFLVVFWSIDSIGYPIEMSMFDKGKEYKVELEYCNKLLTIFVPKSDNVKEIHCNIIKKLDFLQKRGIINCSIPKCN